MMWLIYSFAILSFSLNVFFVWVLKRFVKRLLQFDDIFELINEDVNRFVSSLKDLTNRPLIGNAPEIVAVHSTMLDMKTRFETYTELFNKRKEEKKLSKLPPIGV